jgi:hypothetical protein
LNLATDLRESGVDVILDKWDLKEGHDTDFFTTQAEISNLLRLSFPGRVIIWETPLTTG